MIVFGIQTSLFLTLNIYIQNCYQNVSRLSTKKIYPTTQLWTVSLNLHTVRTCETAVFPYSSILVGVIKNPTKPTKRYVSIQTKITYNRSMLYGHFHQLPVDSVNSGSLLASEKPPLTPQAPNPPGSTSPLTSGSFSQVISFSFSHLGRNEFFEGCECYDFQYSPEGKSLFQGSLRGSSLGGYFFEVVMG